MSINKLKIGVFLLTLISVNFTIGCGVSAKNETDKQNGKAVVLTKNSENKPSINIETNSPADTVRVFYKNLRKNRIREAMFLTNLRPAIEGLTDMELKELQVDFANLAKMVPEEIAINGEIISGRTATVTAKLPDNETDELKVQTLNLKKENDVWILMMVDGKAEQEVKKEGNKYFFALRIETHHNEVQRMLEKLAAIQAVYANQNAGLYGDIPTLVNRGLLSSDIQTSASTGYNFSINLSDDKKSYIVNAVPAVYGQTGNLSFMLESRNAKKPLLKSDDKKGDLLKS